MSELCPALAQTYRYRPPVSLQEVAQRREEVGGGDVQELALGSSQSLLVPPHSGQGAACSHARCTQHQTAHEKAVSTQLATLTLSF